MRLTLVISAVRAGGAERVFTILANWWAAHGAQVTVVTLDDGARPPFFPLDPRIQRLALGVAGDSPNLLAKVRNNRARVRALRGAIEASKPDVVVSFLTETNVLVLLAARGRGIPVLACEHTDPFKWPVGRIWGWLRGRLYVRAARVVLLTESARRYFRPAVATAVIPNPVAVLPAPTRRGRIVAAMGRLAPEKRFDVLLHAFALVRGRFPDWSLILLGEGPLRGELEDLRARLGLGESVQMPGAVPQPEERLAQVGLFVSSSVLEGFPMALCEAMASGLPVIAAEYDVSVHDLIRHGENGLVVRPADPVALAEAMARLMGDESERHRLGNRARDIGARFGLERVMTQWGALLVDVAHAA